VNTSTLLLIEVSAVPPLQSEFVVVQVPEPPPPPLKSWQFTVFFVNAPAFLCPSRGTRVQNTLFGHTVYCVEQLPSHDGLAHLGTRHIFKALCGGFGLARTKTGTTTMQPETRADNRFIVDTSNKSHRMLPRSDPAVNSTMWAGQVIHNRSEPLAANKLGIQSDAVALFTMCCYCGHLMRERSMRPRAFTVLELIATVVVLAIILSVMLPTLAKARIASVQAACMVNMRNTTLLLHDYTMNHREYLPFAKDDEFRMISDHHVRVGGGFHLGQWSYMFPHEWSGLRWNQAMMCPRQPRYDRGATLPSWNAVPTPMYQIASAVHYPDRKPVVSGVAFVWRTVPRRISDVAYPGAKGLFIEDPGFCADGYFSREMSSIACPAQTWADPVSSAMFDGSVRRRSMSSMNPAGGFLPVISTIDGLKGRDL
jgi:competence protein ComGC